MEDMMAQYVTGERQIEKALAKKIDDLSTKDISLILVGCSAILTCQFIIACVTKSDISICNGLFEIKHPNSLSAVVQ